MSRVNQITLHCSIKSILNCQMSGPKGSISSLNECRVTKRCISSHQPPHLPTIYTLSTAIWKSRRTLVRKRHPGCLLSLWIILSRRSTTPTIHTQQPAGAKRKTPRENGSTAAKRLEALNRWKARSWTSYPKDFINARCSTSTMIAQSRVSH